MDNQLFCHQICKRYKKIPVHFQVWRENDLQKAFGLSARLRLTANQMISPRTQAYRHFQRKKLGHFWSSYGPLEWSDQPTFCSCLQEIFSWSQNFHNYDLWGDFFNPPKEHLLLVPTPNLIDSVQIDVLQIIVFWDFDKSTHGFLSSLQPNKQTRGKERFQMGSKNRSFLFTE